MDEHSKLARISIDVPPELQECFQINVAKMRVVLPDEVQVKPAPDATPSGPTGRVADLEIDTVSHEVRRAGKPVELTTKEYAILEYFARNPNRVLTRTQIAEHVWDFDFVSMSNVIDVYIGYLRRKLSDDSEPRLLRTIRGTGYQLRAAAS